MIAALDVVIFDKLGNQIVCYFLYFSCFFAIKKQWIHEVADSINLANKKKKKKKLSKGSAIGDWKAH